MAPGGGSALKKLVLLLSLLVLLTGCSGKTEPLSGQVIDIWQDRLILMPSGGGRRSLELPETLEAPDPGTWVTLTLQNNRILTLRILDPSEIPIPTEFSPEIPQLVGN